MSSDKGLLQHEKTSGDDAAQLQREISSKSPTVEELLRMLSSGSSSSSKKPPPPVPPKPKHGIEMSIEAAKRSLGLIPGFKSMTSRSSKLSAPPPPQPPSEGGDVSSITIESSKTTYQIQPASDTQQARESPTRNFDENNAATRLATSPAGAIAKTRTKVSTGGCTVYDSSKPSPSTTTAIMQNFESDVFSRPSEASNIKLSKGSASHISSRPIVTESAGEANNNNVIRCATNTSTVQIREMPTALGQLSRDIHGNNNGNSVGNKTFSRMEQQPNSKTTKHQVISARPEIEFVDSLTTSAASTVEQDDDGYGDGGDRSVGETLKQLSDKIQIDVGTMMIDDSIKNQPLRTSTPTTHHHSSTQYQIDNNSSSGASTATNNNRSSQNNTYFSHGTTRESNSDNSENDTLNISRETDELADTSVHNQSGCELVGLNDSSSRDNTPKKVRAIEGRQGEEEEEEEEEEEGEEVPTPYTVQIFNETLMSASSSPPDRSEHNKQANNKSEISIHEMETNSLKKLVTGLQDEIQSLNNKVSSLTNKVDDLEYQLDRQRKDNLTTLNKSTSSIYSHNNDHQRDGYSPSNASMQKGTYSRSVSTINKLTPMKSRHINSSLTTGQTSMYSRNSMAAAIGNNSQANNSPSQTLQRAAPTTTNPRRAEAQQHFNTSTYNLNTHSIKRPSANASTNSIYAESSGNKSVSGASISPTPQMPSLYRQRTASPSPYLSLSHKRDQSAYTSMISLSSIGGNSTLKKGSMAGSVSNLSQFDTGGNSSAIASQLSNWPSMSNFVQETHQAKEILYDDEEQVIRMVLYNNLITMRLPTWLGSDYNLDRIIDAPNVKLKLDWVHGYRGRDCRSNIYYLPTGECIYFVASIIILYNLQEKTQRHYLGHTDSIKCLAIHPNKLIAASGQSADINKRPIVRVWNTVSLTTIRVIGFNQDFDRPICCLAFSKHDTGATLAVVDESSEHTITLLDWQREKNWRLAEVNSGHEPVLAIDFHPIDKYSLVAVGKSSVNFWDIRGMSPAKKAGLFDKYDRPKYVLCMTFNDIGDTVTGDSNGNMIIWPRGAYKPQRIIRDAHPGGVFSVLAMKDGSYLTGGRDRRIVEWDDNFAPTGREVELPEHCGGVRFITFARGSQVLVGTLRNAILVGSLDTEFTLIMQGHTEAATALAVHPTQPAKYLTGGFDDQIFLMDSQTHEIEWTKCLATPITAACFSPRGHLLIIGSSQGSWMALDAITQEVLFEACDGTGTVNCIKFSPEGGKFCLGSSDCHIYIYETNETGNIFKRLGTCVGHSAPVKEIDWSTDSCYLQSQSMNFELLFWRAQNCRPLDEDHIIHDLKWASQNCTIGFNVMGIWSDSIDSALINCCDKSSNNKFIVSATDTGYINIYNWPTYYNQCLSQKYNGNVVKLNFIKFLSDDSKLIAVGAKSCATTEWSIDVVDDHLM